MTEKAIVHSEPASCETRQCRVSGRVSITKRGSMSSLFLRVCVIMPIEEPIGYQENARNEPNE